MPDVKGFWRRESFGVVEVGSDDEDVLQVVGVEPDLPMHAEVKANLLYASTDSPFPPSGFMVAVR